MSTNLYRVTCAGMDHVSTSGVAHGIAYVLARDPTEAYEILRKKLDDGDIGPRAERTLKKVELIAEGHMEYPPCGFRLLGVKPT